MSDSRSSSTWSRCCSFCSTLKQSSFIPGRSFCSDLKMFGFWEMLVYIGIVLVGFFYVWKKGVLDWNQVFRPAR